MTNSKFYPPFLPAVIPDCHTTKINHLKHDRSISQLPDRWEFWVRNDTVCGLLTVIGNLNIVGFLKCIFSKSMTFHEFWSKEIALVKSVFFLICFNFLPRCCSPQKMWTTAFLRETLQLIPKEDFVQEVKNQWKLFFWSSKTLYSCDVKLSKFSPWCEYSCEVTNFRQAHNS